MKKIMIIIFFALIISACNNKSDNIDTICKKHLTASACKTEIDMETIDVDYDSFTYTFKNSGEKVTGKTVKYEIDPATNKKYMESVRILKDGKRTGIQYHYYPNGNIKEERPIGETGLFSGVTKIYSKEGNVIENRELKDNKLNRKKFFNEKGNISAIAEYKDEELVTFKVFDDNGNPAMEIYNENGKEKMRQWFMNGEKFFSIENKTGFYNVNDRRYGESLFVPMVILRLKNISEKTTSPEALSIKAIFVNNKTSEEMGDDFKFEDIRTLQPGLSRQVILKSGAGFTRESGIYQADISCQIYFGDSLFATLNVENEVLSSNRIQ